MMNQENLERFRRALAEARDLQWEEAKKAYPEGIQVSDKHIEKMHALLVRYGTAQPSKKQIRKKRMLVALVAALLALLLAGCTVYIYRHEIGAFIECAFSDHAKLAVAAEPKNVSSDIIPEEDRCTLTYIPEGYQLQAEESTIGVMQIWNESNNIIKFKQGSLNALHLQSIEKDYIPLKEWTWIQVYYRDVGEYRNYTWTSSTYIYTLAVPQDMPQEEIVKIIQGVQ